MRDCHAFGLAMTKRRDFMLDNELFLKILKKTLSSGGEYADVFVEHKRPASIQI